jgi:hypothetical protein
VGSLGRRDEKFLVKIQFYIIITAQKPVFGRFCGMSNKER